MHLKNENVSILLIYLYKKFKFCVLINGPIKISDAIDFRKISKKICVFLNVPKKMKIFLDLINLLIKSFKFCVLINGPKKLKVLCFFSSEVLLKLEKLRRDKWTKKFGTQ
jgi:hypothetical protein